MEDIHPSLETLARWLAGELEHEQVLREVMPHLVASCPVCRRLHDEIRSLQQEIGHWSAIVAVQETREAPAMAATLQSQSHEEQLRRIEEDERLQTWGLCHYFLKVSREAVFKEPTKAIEMAQLAVHLSRHLGEAYHSGWVLVLRARAYATLGNARRVLGDPAGAEYAFLRAEECIEKSMIGDPQVEAEILRLKASLRLDQRQFEETWEILDRALALSRVSGDLSGVAKALVKKSKALQVSGNLDGAIALLQESAAEIERSGDTRLFAYSRQNLITFLTLSNRHLEALKLIPEVRSQLEQVGAPIDHIKLRWTEGSIAQGLGRFEEAEAIYREVRSAFLELDKGYDAALVSLDLAALLAEQGRSAELKPLATEMLAAFDARGVHREAFAAFLLFHQACSEQGATLEMIRRVAALLLRCRPE